MEVSPKAIYYQRPAEAALYACYFALAQFIPVSVALITQAHTEARTFALSALDALRTTFAKAGGAEEFITTERPTAPSSVLLGLSSSPSSYRNLFASSAVAPMTWN
jgi:hypothetical protein